MNTLAATQVHNSFSPARLVLDLLDADSETMGLARRLLAAGSVFGFSDNQMRVALSRLVADGLLDNPRRGHYELSGAGAAMRAEIQRWHCIEDQLRAWQGDWCAILTDNLAAEGSTHFRMQTRALQLRGLQRWRPGLWVRPNNLAGGLERLVADLESLGLDALQGSFLMHRLDPGAARELRELWQPAAINAQYLQYIAVLKQALRRLSGRQKPEILVETIQLGSDTIRLLLKDPLLPEEFVNGAARRELIDAMQRYDREGRRQWQLFVNSLEAGSPAKPRCRRIGRRTEP